MGYLLVTDTVNQTIDTYFYHSSSQYTLYGLQHSLNLQKYPIEHMDCECSEVHRTS